MPGRDKIAQFTQVISQAGKQPVIVDVDAFALQNAYEANYQPSPKSDGSSSRYRRFGSHDQCRTGTTSGLHCDISAGGNQYTDLLQEGTRPHI